MDNNNEHTKERTLQEQFCLKKIPRVVVPFFSHTPMAASIAGRVQSRRKSSRGGVWGKVSHSRQFLIIVEQEEICLSWRILFLLFQNILYICGENKQIFHEARKVKSQWETLLLLSWTSVLPWPCLETRSHQVGLQSAALLQKAYTMPNGRTLNYIIDNHRVITETCKEWE